MKKFSRILVVVLVVAFAALALVGCGTPTKDNLTTKLNDAGYTVTVMDSDDIFDATDEAAADFDYALSAVKLADLQVVSVIAFKSSKYVNEYKKELEEDLDDMKDYYGDTVSIKVVGNAIAVGTADALKLV